MDTVQFSVDLPPELIAKLDKRKEEQYKDKTYDEMLSCLVEQGLEIIESRKRKAQKDKP